ncbi:2-oxo-4-hydroxy-4-carboxy-5-ureidoimidazoline decarboxylase [Streptomyces prasinus]|uniref:2-oxo-4-hydroxy-4-carboxy-5-ureidoimidazoline decarboxylase n=1 Tax=Streptomyces prasinus TaxID=67345 RepID=A0ABX6B6Q1_9ACTN|nr:2-oxo-4-hydroxy-4-carboxy-5-ureidoimidazoline decarboxylase [Streptomyces prasinus]
MSAQLSHHPPLPSHSLPRTGPHVTPRGPTLPAHRLPYLPDRVAVPEQSRGVPGVSWTPDTPGTPSGLDRFNAAAVEDAELALLACLHSPRWAARVAAHRPYPDPEALLAAADEAAYDLSRADRAAALAAEALPGLPADAYSAAHTALNAANAAYESRFGHPFVICVDGLKPYEALDHVLEGIRSRLANDPEEERLVAAEELRRLARGRLAALLTRDGLPADV